jgi:hypothetical protein
MPILITGYAHIPPMKAMRGVCPAAIDTAGVSQETDDETHQSPLGHAARGQQTVMNDEPQQGVMSGRFVDVGSCSTIGCMRYLLRTSLTSRLPCWAASPPQLSWRARWVILGHLRSVFFVTLIPCALSHALCSACALVNAAVLGRLTCLVWVLAWTS